MVLDIDRDLNIHVPIFIECLKVLYGYQNGWFNLIRPVRIASCFEQEVMKGSETGIQAREFFGRGNC